MSIEATVEAVSGVDEVVDTADSCGTVAPAAPWPRELPPQAPQTASDSAATAATQERRRPPRRPRTNGDDDTNDPGPSPGTHHPTPNITNPATHRRQVLIASHGTPPRPET